jgi:cell division cycle 14
VWQLEMLFHAVIGDRVYLAERQAASVNGGRRMHFFNTDEELHYVPFCDDFGPMNLASVERFIEILERKLEEHQDCSIVYCVQEKTRHVTNAVFLLGCYMILRVRLSPEAVWSAFEEIGDMTTSYRDSTFEEPDFLLTLVDCWRGLSRANDLGWVDKIDMDEYIHYDSPLEGDLHELVPETLVGFCGPRALTPGCDYLDHGGSRTFAPSFYLEPFGDMGVSTVVRLNEPEYDAADFTSHGIKLVDLQFDDCSAPPASIIAAFLELMRDAPGAVAVHCRAGLGRTGTLAAAYLMAAHGFTAREAMGWLRIVRPGSVIGEQQRFLCELERMLRRACTANCPLPPPHARAAAAAAPAFEPIPEDAPVFFDGGDCCASSRREITARDVAVAAASGARVQAKLLERKAAAAAAAAAAAPTAGDEPWLPAIVGPA